jgi:putative isomerase
MKSNPYMPVILLQSHLSFVISYLVTKIKAVLIIDFFSPSCLMGSVCLLVLMSACKDQADNPIRSQVDEVRFAQYPDILNLTGIPDSTSDRSVFVFSDLGAWFAYALPDADKGQSMAGFSGPFLLTQDNGCWISPLLARLKLINNKTGVPITLNSTTLKSSHSYPGRLKQVFVTRDPQLIITTTLIFANSSIALQQFLIENPSKNEDIALQAQWNGELLLEEATFSTSEEGVRIDFAQHNTIGLIAPLPSTNLDIKSNNKTYSITSPAMSLKSGEKWELNLAHVFCFSETAYAKQLSELATIAKNPTGLLYANAVHWNALLEKTLSLLSASFSDDSYKRVAVKCLQTLTTNWRSAAGFLQHDGLFPSYNYEWFHGFWSWDSWKQAVALAYYDTELAQNQIKAMYDFQDDLGMIADCVYRDTIIEVHNWRDTKPPLSTWAIWRTYEQSKDVNFLKAMFPKAEKYHQWWYKYRDHDQNGLCEYGSTDGTLVAAKWESGMDNAVRFDDVELVQNNAYAWSMNRESVDLNAYLFAEKGYLAQIAEVLGDEGKQENYLKESEILKQQIQSVFYDEESGWFYDVDLKTKEQLKAYGAEGWIPLWAKAASHAQAERLRETMTDTSKFATYIPFPTLAADHPRFDPNGSYWRGPVWLDQAYFAITGLRNYGYDEDAERFTHQLLNRLEGLKDGNLPIRENYHPLTGEGLESSHFSWSAAHLLLLLWEE